MEWLLAPIDPDRAHLVSAAIAWHGRSMVLAWGVLAPLAILTARFLKVLPGQDWPRERDTQFWWRTHWMGQSAVLLLTIIGIGLVVLSAVGTDLHGILGYTLLALVILQVACGIFRGSKGGPTAPAPDGSLRGDHYDMTRWRLIFEFVHKSLGYLLIGLGAVTVGLGLWDANAPRWMWIAMGLWWSALLVVAVMLQRRGFAIDTYQAIWGPGLEHPGNNRAAPGWGMRRIGEDEHVRRD